MKDSYKTIKKLSEGLFKDRASKFYAFAYPVNSEDEIKEILARLRKKYHDARHHCYAWKLGCNPGHSRANDDGEPSSSAGKPILNQIEKYELTNVLIVVIRYFGGTLLGVGGLINAYRTAAAEAITQNNIVTEFIYETLELKFEYPLMNSVMKIIKDYELESYNHVFEIDCSINVRVKIDRINKIREKFEGIQGCSLV